MNPLETLRKIADRAVTESRQAERQVAVERASFRKAVAHLKAAGEARDVIQGVAQAVQARAHEQVTKVVNHCLKTVFGDSAYEFEIEFLRKRGRTEAKMWFVRNGHRVEPLSGAGGGCVDVAALALRLACLLLATPRRRKLIVLDEPFKNVHGREYRERAARLIETLAEEFGVQFLLVTGLDWLKIGKVIELNK